MGTTRPEMTPEQIVENKLKSLETVVKALLRQGVAVEVTAQEFIDAYCDERPLAYARRASNGAYLIKLA